MKRTVIKMLGGPQSLAQIEKAVSLAEQNTSAEIVVAIYHATFYRSFLGIRRPHTALRAHVEKLFMRKGFHRTQARNGVLLYVSLKERAVVVLGDIGIHARIEEGTWDQIVESLVLSARTGDLTAGIVAAVQKMGALLAQHFPPQAGRVNELLNSPEIG